MNRVELKPGVYSVGAVDWNVRSFHGYSASRGVTYNSYLIIDEKITLIDAVKDVFADELLARISDIIDPARIDYIVSNHVEMDHSGAIPAVVKAAPNATIVTSSPSGFKGLQAHYGSDFKFLPVKAGDTLSIGKRTLQFVGTPMLHWPDNMVTYCPEEKILFSNDAFGQHYSTTKRFDDEVDLSIAIYEAQKYYANILMPYGAQARKALEIVKGLDMDMIAPSHGIIWRSHIDEIIKQYEYYSNDEPDDVAIVVYDSMWHSTEKMAFRIVEGFARKGLTVKYFDLKVNEMSDIMAELLKAKYIAVGSSTLNNQMLPNVAAFLCYLKGLAPKNKKAFAFGSYGWGGQGIPYVNEELKACGLEIVLDPIKQLYIPTPEQLDELENMVANIE
ncbi:FprA family A-type flavoprotein [Clostridium sp. Marseille-P299]|uniref:FprA family A-type flavoprotein n=1 Tax=Clostridium sp. Marseille-P299 TaxID=1805477 RepID=UPI00083406AA|nr:FprA family A-type flavoprotein [Clostridium sp. Marseille-P299]